MNIISLSPQQLRAAADLKERIERLQTDLNSILGGTATTQVASEAPVLPGAAKKGRRTFSAESRAKMAASQKARWAEKRGVKAEATPATTTTEPKKRQVSPALLKALAKARAARSAKLMGKKGKSKAEPKAKTKVVPALRNVRSEAAKAMWAKRKAAKAKKVDDSVPF